MHIYNCDEWGARPPAHSFPSCQMGGIVIHHMDWPNRALVSDPVQAKHVAFEVARRCQADHMDGNGWSDTGQHFTVSRDGIVLEGRHGSLSSLVARHGLRGAHAADPDTGADRNDWWGIENEGTYTSDPMPSPQWNSLMELVGYIAFHGNLDTADVVGHLDTGCRTACPGNWLHGKLADLRHGAHLVKLALMQGVVPAVPTSLAAPADPVIVPPIPAVPRIPLINLPADARNTAKALFADTNIGDVDLAEQG